MMNLVGFLNPTTTYPAIVVPVWEDEAGLYASFRTKNEEDHKFELVSIPEDSSYISLPNNWDDTTVSACLPIDVSLIALDQAKIIGCHIDDEQGIILNLLSDLYFCANHPHVRLAFSKQTRSPLVIIKELQNVVNLLLMEELYHQGGQGVGRILDWLCNQKASLIEQYQSSDIIDLFEDSIPTNAEDLVENTWWKQAYSEKQKTFSLVEIEDRYPSPKRIAVLNTQPIVPNNSVLPIMTRHLASGTNYSFFHAPSANQESLLELKLFADKVEEDASRMSESPLSATDKDNVGSIKFFSINRQWTGSPFIFYEDIQEGKICITGYRGKDNNASISESYEKLRDDYALELLEALMSSPPEEAKFEIRDTNLSSVSIDNVTNIKRAEK